MKKTREDIQKEALGEAIQHYRGSLGMSMGSGKTLVGLQYVDHFYKSMSSFSLNVLVAVPKLVMIDSWNHERIKHNMDHLKDHINYSTYLSLNKLDPADYDILILDEVHNLTDSHREWLNKFQGRILGLSGTMPKYAHSEKGKMVNDFCPEVYTYTTDEAVGDSILNDYRIIVHEIELSTKKNMWVQKKNTGWWSSERADYEYWTKRVMESSTAREQQIMRVMRMKALQTYKSKEIYAKKLFEGIDDKAIIFCNTQQQAMDMCSHYYFSKNPTNEENLEKFKAGEIQKLSAVQMLSEGVNIPDLKQAVIIHSFSGSSPKSSQKLGRILRLSPNETAVLHILAYKSCIDWNWVTDVLSGFDPSKISYKPLVSENL